MESELVMNVISSSGRSVFGVSSSGRQPPAGAPELEQKLRGSGLSEEQVRSTMKTLFGEKGAGGGGTLDGTEGAGSQAFALKLQSALMNAGVSNSDAQKVVSSVGPSNGSTAAAASSASASASSASSSASSWRSDALTGKVDSFDASTSTSSRKAPAGAEEMEARLRSAGLSEEQVKATMKKLYGERGSESGGTVDGATLQLSLMSAGLSDASARRVVSSVGSNGNATVFGYSSVSSFE